LPLHFFTAPAAAARLEAALAALSQFDQADRIVIVGASRAAADELAFVAAARRGGLFGVTRVGLAELVTKLALPGLARQGLSPTSALGAEAIAARATFTTHASGRLGYFSPVADLPGFPRALTRTIAELRLGHVSAAELTALNDAGADLARLLDAVADESSNAGAVDRATLLETAACRR
jgi:hypothetical protein